MVTKKTTKEIDCKKEKEWIDAEELKRFVNAMIEEGSAEGALLLLKKDLEK